ncbi:MAG: sensor histidine kinase [Ferruginibacter sp.]
MATIYHFVLAIIQRNSLLIHYSAYLLAATFFLAERTLIGFIFTAEHDLQSDFYYNLIDEPAQLLIYLTYLNFTARALNFFSFPDRKLILFYRIVIIFIIAYIIFHCMGMGFHWFLKRSVPAFISIRIILMLGMIYLLIKVSRYITGLFFQFIIAGSFIMFAGNLMAFITSLTKKYMLGMYGVTWTCAALLLDVICISAALGYKARKDLLEKQEALNEVIHKEKQLQQQELEKISAIYLARDAERNRIARDLHDEIGSTLSSIHIYSSVAEKMMVSNPEKTKQVLKQINVNTISVMENMSDIVWAMKTGDQQDILLSNKIKNIGYELLNAKNINCSYEIETKADTADLDIDMRRNILLIVKESLNNTAKYSNAAEANIKMTVHESVLDLYISDNGKGFDMETVQKGNGLQNIQYRVKQCGGSLEITAADGNGTAIHCSFPIATIRDEN